MTSKQQEKVCIKAIGAVSRHGKRLGVTGNISTHESF
jgi:hypothetical protein